MRILAWVGGLFILVAIVVYGGLWLLAQRTIPLSVAISDRAAAVSNADRILELGPEPGKWSVRLFVPASALQDIAGTVTGTSYQVPFGAVGPNGPDGFLVAKIRNLKFIPADFLLRARVEMDVTYLPVNRAQWWGDATIGLTGDADMLPMKGKGDGPEMLSFRLVPTGFSPGIRWGPLNVAATEMLSQVIASHLLERLGQELIVPIPPFTVPIDVHAGMVATHEADFPVEGGFKVSAQLDGRSLHGEITTDRLLIVSSGVWLLGGLPGVSDPPPSSSLQKTEADLDERILATRARLAPFQRKSAHAEAHIPIAPILSLAEGNARPDMLKASPGADPAAPMGENFDIRIGITEASGTMFRTELADNRVVGNISLAVLPASQDFASGTLSIAPPELEWKKGEGLTGRLDATVHGKARLRAYLSSSRLRQGMGADLGVSGTTKTSIPFSLDLKLLRETEGSALVLVPDVSCTRVAVDLHQDAGTGPLFSTGWFTLQSAGVRVERNIGGGTPASIALIDSKPRYVPFPVEGPLAQGVTFPSDGIALTVAPRSLVMGEDGIDVVVSLHARAASRGEQAKFASEREGLLATLKQGLPEKTCDPDQRFRLLLGAS